MNEGKNGQEPIEEQLIKKAGEGVQKAGKKAGRAVGKLAGKVAKSLGKKFILFLISNPLIAGVLIVLILIAFFLSGCTYSLEIQDAEDIPEIMYQMAGIEDFSELVQIVGNENDGYHLEWVEDFDEKLDLMIKEINKETTSINSEDKDMLKLFLKAQISSQFPNLGGEIEVDSLDEFQGAAYIRRISPNKEIGEYNDSLEGETTIGGGTVTNEEGLGYKLSIPLNIQNNMKNKSISREATSIAFENYSYLTIPYYDLNGIVHSDGHMIVDADIADEVLLIFQELYNIKYQMASVKLVDDFVKFIYLYRDNNYISEIENASYESNNTYSFLDFNPDEQAKQEASRNSLHSKGLAIDINPQYKIDKESELYKIFEKYGWIVGQDEEGRQHFEKKDLSKIATIQKVENDDEEEEKTQEDENTKNTDNLTTADGNKHIVAIASGHSASSEGASTATLDERQINKKVAKYVEQMLSIYSNIEVVQTGDCVNSKRKSKAEKANADICIQIHQNAGGGSGIETYYKKGDNASKVLGEILAKNMAKSMGLDNKGTFDDTKTAVGSLGIIWKSSENGIESVVTEGGYIDGNPDSKILGTKEGLKKQAQGIVDGILEYFEIENQGYGEITATTTEGIDSKIDDLKYVEQEKFKELVKNNDEEALKVYTLDSENKLITATWSYDNGKIEISENSSVDYRASLSKFTMPFEYPLFFYLDTDDKEFAKELAKLAIDSTYIVAVQDNVYTTKTVTTQQIKTYTRTEEYRISEGEGGRYVPKSSAETDWDTIDKKEEINEMVTTNIEVTYADAWCVKFEKESSYTVESFQNAGGGVSYFTGEPGEYLGKFRLTGYCKDCNGSYKGTAAVAWSGVSGAKAGRTIAVNKNQLNGNPFNYGDKVVINNHVYQVEDFGTARNVIDIFCKSHSEENGLTTSGYTVPVYRADNVSESISNETLNDNDSQPEKEITIVSGLTDKVQGSINYESGTDIEIARGTEKTVRNEDGTILTVSRMDNKTIVDTNICSNEYKSGKSIITGNERKFVALYRNYYDAKGNVAPEWLFEMIETNEKTANMLDLTKYLIYKATNEKRYEIKDFDFEEMFGIETVEFTTGDYVVKTDESNAAPVVTDKTKLQTALKKWLKSNSAAKNNALDILDTVLECQEKYNVNGIFVYAFLKQETTMGTANTSYVKDDNNWGSWNLGTSYASPQDNIETIMKGIATGQYYFTKNRITVSQIGERYCPNESAHPNQGDDWIEKITNNMTDLYELLGINTGTGTLAKGGAGTIGVYTSTKGRTFNLYLQGSGAPWEKNDYGNSGSMALAGCGPTAAAIIASGYDGSITPETFRKATIERYGRGNHSSATYMKQIFKDIGVNVKTKVGDKSKAQVRTCLENGGQVWLVVTSGSKYTSGSHCIALIDYDKAKDKVYVAHGTAKSRAYGWESLDYVLRYNKYDNDGLLYVGG